MEREPTRRELDDMIFGWAVEHGVTSNSVIYVKDGCTVGIGTGEQDRVGVAEIAVHKAYIKYADILCFDKFGIPYADMVLEIQQGKRGKADQEAIDAQDQGRPGRAAGLGDDLRRLFPVQRRSRCRHQAGGDRYPSGRWLGPGFRNHHGL